MDMDKLCAFWSVKQGLDRLHPEWSPRQTLAKTGWQRAVGGSNPYQAIWARTGHPTAMADQAAKDIEIHELPSARGCTYVLPKDHFAIGLRVAEGTSERAAIQTAIKHLGFTEEELVRLCAKMMDVVSDEPKDPKALREAMGDVVRNFGEEGKKRGQTTSLGLALGKLQVEGKIRRVPNNGRLDNERFGYARWNDSPLDDGAIDRQAAFVALAQAFWGWLGIAKAADFQWFTSLGVKASKEVLDQLELQPVEPGSDWLALPETIQDFAHFSVPAESKPVLVSCLDSIILLRRDAVALVAEKHQQAVIAGEKGRVLVGGVKDIDNHVILDRGRIIGIWEFDMEAGELVWHTFDRPTEAIREAVAKTEVFVRDDAGDARGFSLDGVKSRKPKIALLKELASAHA